MNKKLRVVLLMLITLGVAVAAVLYLRTVNIPVLEPKGTVGMKERNLIFLALGLSMIVVIPVFTLLFVFAWRYRASNIHAKYSPDLAGSRLAETIWWFIPGVIIFILSIVTWNSSHALDPYKALASPVKSIDVQVVSLDWKWLFIYPQQNIATVNYLQVPANTPIHFDITSDTVMNSFWVPSLGGQIYAMPGMSTQLNLMANQPGTFNGMSANISGKGFSGMTFTVTAGSQASFNNWVQSTKKLSNPLTINAYDKLAKPSENNVATSYSSVANGLYNTIVMKYMMPMQDTGNNMDMGSMQNMNMGGM